MLRRCVCLMYLCISFLLFSHMTLAFWPEGGAIITAGSGNQYLIQVLADGTNGVFVFWRDDSAATIDLYVQHYDSAGNKLWQEDGVCVKSQDQDEYIKNYKMIRATDGSIIVSWLSDRTFEADVYLQRVSAEGNPAWPAPKKCSNITWEYNICSDGAKGAILAWEEFPSRIYVQRVSDQGVLMWGENGIEVAMTTSATSLDDIVLSEVDKVLIFWKIFPSHQHFVRKVEAGTVVWPNAKTVCANFSGSDFISHSDRQKGAVIYLNNSPSSLVQRIDANGNELWGPAGVALQSGSYQNVAMSVSPEGHTLLTCHSNSISNDVFAQRINYDGSLPWGSSNKQITNIVEDQELPVPVVFSDRTLGIIWRDRRSAKYQLYHQQLDTDGRELLAVNGEPISVTPTMTVADPHIAVPDNTGRAIVFWTADNGTDKDVWAMKINLATRLSPAYLTSTILRSNELDKPVLVCQLSATGYDNLTALQIKNFGDAVAESDISRVRMYLSNDLEYNSATAILLDEMRVLDGKTWQTSTGFSPGKLKNGQHLIFTIDLSGKLTPRRICQFGFEPGSVYFDSNAQLPIEQIVNPSFQILELMENLTVKLFPLITYPLFAGQSAVRIAQLQICNQRAEPFIIRKIRLYLKNVEGSVLDPNTVISRIYFPDTAGVWSTNNEYIELQFEIDQVLEQTLTYNYVIALDLLKEEEIKTSSISLYLEKENSIFDNTRSWIALNTQQAGGFPLSSPALAIKTTELKHSYSNFPNPFRRHQGTRIGYHLESQAKVSLSVWTLTGRRVRMLLDCAPKESGRHQEDLWDGKNELGYHVKSGTYLLLLKVNYTNGKSQTLKRKISLVR